MFDTSAYHNALHSGLDPYAVAYSWGFAPQKVRFIVEPWLREVVVQEGARREQTPALAAALVAVCARSAGGVKLHPTLRTIRLDEAPLKRMVPHSASPSLPTSGVMTRTFGIVRQMNMQSVRATIRSSHCG